MALKNMQLWVFAGLLLISATVFAAPQAEYWDYWDHSNERNFQRIDHSDWDALLKQYVLARHPSGVNRFRYGDVSPKDQKRLQRYIDRLADIDPRKYARQEQKAYWMNLYNALTVQLVVENYPIASINDLGGKLFSRGPWDQPLVKVAGEKLSFNDIEHRILRPIWKDHKIHFGLNCASVSCPNLLPQAFTGSNVRQQLKQAGRDYINHHRGVHLQNGKLQASSIFKWYQEDFAKDEKQLLRVFAHYADDRLALYLLGFQGDIDFHYDWSLNAP